MTSIDVHLIDGTPWWQPWLPLIATLPISLTTILVMFRTLAANRKAELNKWRRDALFKALGRATELSTWCESHYANHPIWVNTTPEQKLNSGRELEKRTTELGAIITQLFLIHAYESAYAVRFFRTALHDAVRYMLNYDNLVSDRSQRQQYDHLILYLRQCQNNIVSAGRRQLDGKALGADAAEAAMAAQPTLKHEVGDPTPRAPL